jgi:hypothetical protein
MTGVIRVYLLAILSISLAVAHAPKQAAPGQTAPTAAELRINGAVATPLVLTLADLKNMPRKKLSVVNPHDQKTEVYEGILLEELLRKAGVAHGENLRGPAMASYVLAEGADGYRVASPWRNWILGYSTPR